VLRADGDGARYADGNARDCLLEMAKKKTNRAAPVETLAPSKSAWAERAGRFLHAHSLALAIALILIGSLRIAATYTVFNHTIDEPAHNRLRDGMAESSHLST
jgi:hypothetical protein